MPDVIKTRARSVHHASPVAARRRGLASPAPHAFDRLLAAAPVCWPQVPFARAKGAALASVTCAPGSKLDAAADLVVNLPLLRELCPFALAPVTSSSLQLLFGDTIAVALVQERGLTQDRYMLNHPAGRIGRRLALSVRDVMLAGEALPVVAPGARLMDALVEMSGKR